MNNYDHDTAAALAQAGASALTSGRPDNGPVDPDTAHRALVDQLATFAPTVATAAALVTSHGLPAVPLDRDTLTPTRDPLITLSEVVEHYRTNYADGVGITAGAHPGRTVFAVRGPLENLRHWLERVGTEPAGARHTWRSIPAFIQLAWSPPPPPRAVSTVAFGDAVNSDPLALRGDHRDRREVASRTAWLCWSVPDVWAVPPAYDAEGITTRGQGLQRLKVRDRKLGDGVEVIAAGVIPWHVRRGDGWTLSSPTMPRDADSPMPAWLLDAVGAKWEATR